MEGRGPMIRPFVYRYTYRGHHVWLVGAGRTEYAIGTPHSTWELAYTAALKIASKATA